MYRIGWLPFVVALMSALSPRARGEESVRFRQEVMAVLSRGGCNQGTCHGNFHGKGGFKLSLRGEDADRDYATLTRDMMGRRIDRAQPDQSLILQKSTARLPHEGGKRFPAGSLEYETLKRWIAEGAALDPLNPRAQPVRLVVEPREAILAPPAQVTIRAWAVYADGSRKDVSRLAVFESTSSSIAVSRLGLVESREPGETTIVARYLHLQGTAALAFVPARADFHWSKPDSNNYVDDLVFAQLKKLRMNPSAPCTDSELLRRAYLDLLGILPTPQETRHFLGDRRPDKRAKLVDSLLERPEYAEHWALRWSDLLRVEEKQLDRKGVTVFHEWLRESFARNKPLNQLAHELIASRGSTYRQPAANYYRALRDPYTRAEATAQVFLGIRMQCARCHNHPFDRWTQNDYHQLAGFFARVQYRIVANNRKDKLDKHEFVGEQVVYMDGLSEVRHPSTELVMRPRFLGGRELARPARSVPHAAIAVASLLLLADGEERLRPLADWVAAPANPLFARTQANRIWSYLMGHGLVEPNDDFRQTNPPINGPLLDALTQDLVKHNFDQKHILRTIMNSRTYQTSGQPNATNVADDTHFSHTEARSLSAEALLDTIAQVTATPLHFEGYPEVKRAGQLPSLPTPRRGQSSPDTYRFLRTFGKPERLLSCDCERSDSTTLAQALQLITGKILNEALTEPDNRLGKLLQAGRSNREIIEELYLASLCRPPSAAERSALEERVAKATNRREALEDVLWGLLNSKAFLLRR
jgi:hypothetical protein